VRKAGKERERIWGKQFENCLWNFGLNTLERCQAVPSVFRHFRLFPSGELKNDFSKKKNVPLAFISQVNTQCIVFTTALL
jgi:hypothetical protein